MHMFLLIIFNIWVITDSNWNICTLNISEDPFKQGLAYSRTVSPILEKILENANFVLLNELDESEVEKNQCLVATRIIYEKPVDVYALSRNVKGLTYLKVRY